MNCILSNCCFWLLYPFHKCTRNIKIYFFESLLFTESDLSIYQWILLENKEKTKDFVVVFSGWADIRKEIFTFKKRFRDKNVDLQDVWQSTQKTYQIIIVVAHCCIAYLLLSLISSHVSRGCSPIQTAVHQCLIVLKPKFRIQTRIKI